jgi:hypothetical protein
VAFFLATQRTIAVFGKNADHVSKVRGGDLDVAGEKELRRLDRLNARYFLAGVVLTGAIAVSTGLAKLNQTELSKEEIMNEVRQLRESLAGIAAQRPSSLDQKSLAGIAGERPVAPAPAVTTSPTAPPPAAPPATQPQK